jgi:hypothetical protein
MTNTFSASLMVKRMDESAAKHNKAKMACLELPVAFRLD